MNVKHGNAGTVLLALLAGSVAQAQVPMNLPPLNDAPSIRTPADPFTASMPPTGKPLADTPAREAPADPFTAGLPPTGKPLSMPASALTAQAPSVDTAPAMPPISMPSPTFPAAPAGAPVMVHDGVIVQQPGPIPYAPPTAGCCGPVGRDGSIGTEVYVQTGPNFLLSNSAFAKSLHTGYEVGLAGRTLFFNREGTRDWNVILDVNFTSNDGIPTHTFNFQTENGQLNSVSIRSLNRTAVGLGLGYDWFLLGAGNVGVANGPNLSTGFDGGARWGTSSLEMNVINMPPDGFNRIQHIYAEGYAGWRSNLEVPMGGWTWLTGLRLEYSYSSLHLLPMQQNTGLHNLNLMVTTGVRY